MKNRFLHKILAILLLGVFTFNTTPREFIHQFMNHHDTKDVPVCHDGLVLSVKHQHCGFLQIEPLPYEHTSQVFVSLVRPLLWSYVNPGMPAISYSDYRLLSPRAPPAISFL